MSFENAKKHLESRGYGDRIRVFEVSSATVDLAAAALGTEPCRIAKSLTFLKDGTAVMIVCAGDRKIDNGKYKAAFHTKAKMLTREEVNELVGHDVGGVCPFGIRDGVEVWLDVSLKEYDTVFPACGSSNSAVRLTPEELEQVSCCRGWTDVCKLPETI